MITAEYYAKRGGVLIKKHTTKSLSNVISVLKIFQNSNYPNAYVYAYTDDIAYIMDGDVITVVYNIKCGDYGD